MTCCRTYLIWLCCALVLCTGVPLRASAACEKASSQPTSCCGGDCRCSEQRAGACDCCGERIPERTPPPPPAPKLQLPAPELLPRCDEPPALAPAKVEDAYDAQLPPGMLPSRSRQEVLSVWRC